MVDPVLKKWLGCEKKEFIDRKKLIYAKRLLEFVRKQVDFKWIVGRNNHPQNERYDELAVMASMQKHLLIDTFMKTRE
jgi:ribonuclease HI